MSNTPETDQLEECDQYKVDEDYAEYNAYRGIVSFLRDERERDEWQGRTNDDCFVCGGCFMIPGTEPNDDVMNTPCPKCNSQHYKLKH